MFYGDKDSYYQIVKVLKLIYFKKNNHRQAKTKTHFPHTFSINNDINSEIMITFETKNIKTLSL